MQTTRLVAIFVGVCSMMVAVGNASADDVIIEEQIRNGLYLELGDLPDGASIRNTFDKAFSGDPSAAPELIALLRHSNESVAYEAGRVLGRFASGFTADALKQAFASDNRGIVRIGALIGLVGMRDPAAGALALLGLSDPEGIMQTGGLAVLSMLGDSSASPAILTYLDSSSRRADSDMVIEILGKLGDPPGTTAVRDRLAAEANNKTNEWDVRRKAAEGLRTMGMADLVRRVLDREDASLTYDRMIVLRGEIRRLASRKNLAIAGQSDVDVLLNELRASDPQDKDDYWGRPLRARFVPNDAFCVVSDGPDKRPNTADDMSTAEPFATYDLRTFANLFPPR